ncbi:MAG: DEAD/DEAH box helicase [Planctomycetota bacterium]|nr:DEAD/DEAH box helicase [Planctomycetota bacterium]
MTSEQPETKKRSRRRRSRKKRSDSPVVDAQNQSEPEVQAKPKRKGIAPNAEVFDLDLTFKAMGLNDEILKAIDHLGYEHPTKIQAELIPMALTGRDVLGQSKTGTGKTAAFCLPVLQMTDESEPFSTLILVPTRELAIQVTREMQILSKFTKLISLAVYGGQSTRIQAEKLKQNPQIIIGTPGRVMDMHSRGLLPYDKMKVAILDEVDRMLDIGFRDDIRRILGVMKQDHQTIFVSATISEDIERLARQFMTDPQRLNISSSKSLTVEQVNQKHFTVQPWDKNYLLLHLLKHEDPTLTLVFCRTKQTCDGLTRYLQRKGIDAHALHADLHQGKRNQVMHKLREGTLSVLVASDLAARGLDVDDITHVINYDLPEDPDVYVHRIGRTARAGRDGIAWAFVTPEQGALLTAIEMLTNVEIPIAEYQDFKPGPVPADIQMREAQKVEREKSLQTRFNSRDKPPSETQALDLTKFPGGVVPICKPSKKMGGRVPRRR